MKEMHALYQDDIKSHFRSAIRRSNKIITKDDLYVAGDAGLVMNGIIPRCMTAYAVIREEKYEALKEVTGWKEECGLDKRPYLTCDGNQVELVKFDYPSAASVMFSTTIDGYKVMNPGQIFDMKNIDIYHKIKTAQNLLENVQGLQATLYRDAITYIHQLEDKIRQH